MRQSFVICATGMRLSDSMSTTSAAPLRKMEWLEATRGFAAICVLLHHAEQSVGESRVERRVACGRWVGDVAPTYLPVWGKRLAPDPQERKLWTWIALAALLCLPIVSFATTAVDRVALYLIPIQIFVFSRIPRLAGGNIRVRTGLVLGVIGYYAAVLFVWLNFATHSQYWVPYQFKPFV